MLSFVFLYKLMCEKINEMMMADETEWGKRRERIFLEYDVCCAGCPLKNYLNHECDIW